MIVTLRTVGILDDLIREKEFSFPEETVPLRADPDDDGLSDADEGERGTDPLDADTDDGGRTDGQEVNTDGTDPLARLEHYWLAD